MESDEEIEREFRTRCLGVDAQDVPLSWYKRNLLAAFRRGYACAEERQAPRWIAGAVYKTQLPVEDPPQIEGADG